MICAGNAWLETVSGIGFGDGIDAGARYSTLPAGAMLTNWHGFDATTQICPTLVLPPGIPLTCQITFVFALPEMVTVNGWRWLTALVALPGVNVSAPGIVSVTVASPEAAGFAALTA